MINRIKVFELEESAYQPNKYILRFYPDRFHCENTTGSFAVMAARVAGLPYGMYCRFCRDALGAEIIGKGNMYPIVYFKKTSETMMFVRLLNARANLVLWEKDNRDWIQHQKQLLEHQQHLEELADVSKTR